MGKKIHQIPNTANVADLNDSTYIAVDSSTTGTKKLPANLLATKSVQDNLSGSIAPLFSESKSYAVGDPVMDTDGKLYRCTVAHSAGAWNSDHFTLDTATHRIKNLTDNKYTGYVELDDADGTGKFPIDNLIGSIAPIFDSTRTSTNAYIFGDFVMYQGKRRMCVIGHYGDYNSDHFVDADDEFADFFGCSKTPYHLGVVAATKGYITPETLIIATNTTPTRAIYGSIHVGAGTEVRVIADGSPAIKGFSVLKYSAKDGSYLGSLGNVVNNLSPVIVDEECLAIVYVNTNAEDAATYYSEIEKRIRIKNVEPSSCFNLYESNFEQGTISNGIPQSSTTRVRTDNFIAMGKGSVLINKNLTQIFSFAKYSIVDGTYIGAVVSNLPCIKLDNDCLVKVVVYNRSGSDILPAEALIYQVPVSMQYYAQKKLNPSDLRAKSTCGYVTSTTAAINRSLNKMYAIFGWLHLGKGSIVTLDSKLSVGVFGIDAYLYSDTTGEFIEAVGTSISVSSRNIIIPYDCMALVRVKVDADDATDYLDELNSHLYISLVSPMLVLNPYPSDVEQGSIDQGQPYSSTIRCRPTRFVLMGKGSIIHCTNINDIFNVMRYSVKDKGYYDAISANTNLPCYKVPEDCWVKFIEGHDQGGTFDVADASMMTFIAPASDLNLPPYYYDDDYIQGRAAEVNSHDADCSINGDSFIFITDTHWASNMKKSPQLIEYLLEKTCVKKVFFGGDAITKYDTKDEAKAAYNEFRGAMAGRFLYNWMPVIGNHELNNPGATEARLPITLSSSEAYGLVTKENEYIVSRIDDYSYYVDNKVAKIRYVFVGCSYTSAIPSSVSDNVVAVLGSLPAGYKVLVISHVGIKTDGTIDSSFLPILTALDAMQTNENVIGVISGHRHFDGSVTTSAGTNVIATTCDAMIEYSGSQLARTCGTITEQAFDVVQIDLTNRKLYLTRVGAGSDREFSF